MLVGIGNKKKIKVVAKMTYAYEGQMVQNMSCLASK